MRLSLRPLRASDADPVLAWRNQPDVAAHMYADAPVAPAEHAAWMAASLEGRERRVFVVEVEGEGVGIAALSAFSARGRRCDWAYYLARADVRGQGVGAAVEYAVIEHAFGPLGLNKLWCEVFVENEAVWRLHERFGFQIEARYRAHVFREGRPRDVLGLGLLAADWAPIRAGSAARLRARGFDPEAFGPPPPAPG